MEIIREDRENITVFNISGCMTGDTVGFFRQYAEDCLKSGRNQIILHMENVLLIDSSGVGAIVFFVKRCRPLGDVRISGVRGHVEKIFCMLRLYKIIDMYPSVNDAVRAFRKRDQKIQIKWWKNFFEAVSKRFCFVVYRYSRGEN